MDASPRLPPLSPLNKISERFSERTGLPDSRHDRGAGRVGGAEEGVRVADHGVVAAGNGSKDDQGKKSNHNPNRPCYPFQFASVDHLPELDVCL